jgi:translation initiation factor eIF-2B subunit alpha
MVAKAMRKPFYVAVESYKFARMYPLSQRDVADLCEDSDNFLFSNSCFTPPLTPAPAQVALQRPSIDFTPAEYITLLFTDLGVLTPAAVSDELIKLYQ